MNDTFSSLRMDYHTFFLSKSKRQRVVAFALSFTEATHLEPGPYELQLLEKFIQGEITLDQIETCLEQQEPATDKLL